MDRLWLLRKKVVRRKCLRSTPALVIKLETFNKTWSLLCSIISTKVFDQSNSAVHSASSSEEEIEDSDSDIDFWRNPTVHVFSSDEEDQDDADHGDASDDGADDGGAGSDVANRGADGDYDHGDNAKDEDTVDEGATEYDDAN